MFPRQLFLCKIQIISGKSSASVAVIANFTYTNYTRFCCERQVNIKLFGISASVLNIPIPEMYPRNI